MYLYKNKICLLWIKNVFYSTNDHFRDLTKMIIDGSGLKREVIGYMLTHHACYIPKRNLNGVASLKSLAALPA